MKKIILVLLAFSLFMFFATKSIVAKAYEIEDNLDETQKDVTTTIRYREHWASWWNRWNYHYFEDTITVSNNGIPKRVMLKNITGTIHWNHATTEFTLGYSKKVSVSKTTTFQVSREMGFTSSFLRAAEFSETLKISFSKSRTFTVEELASYETKITKANPKGYYSLQSAITAYLYDFSIRWRDLPSDPWKFLAKGQMLAYTTNNPYLYIRYTKDAH